MGVKEVASLYEMTAQSKKWWGDPSSPDFTSDGMNLGHTSINRKVGVVFSEKDQYILKTLFYPFNVKFGYEKENSKQFAIDLAEIEPMLNDLFDFEKKLIKNLELALVSLRNPFFRLFAVSIAIAMETLKKYRTYPNLINLLQI